MAKKHIITFGYQDFACDSITAANQAVAILSKLVPVDFDYEGSHQRVYKPDTRANRASEITLKLNQEFREPPKPRKEKTLALPKPARGTIRCICNKSDVSPRQNCPHCGRPFSESHNRTHGEDRQHGEHPRLL